MSKICLNNKKAIVITSIHKPNKFIEFYSNLDDWDLIIVADIKTDPTYYKKIKCVFLSLEEQKRLFPTIYELIPFNSYTRKMFGYLYCLKEQYDIIYDTDDDNINTELLPKEKDTVICNSIDKLINVYSFYTDTKYNNKNILYPRGFPVQYVNHNYDTEIIKNLEKNVAVIQGLVNGDPDIDAKCRIPFNNPKFNFNKNLTTDLILAKDNYCPFNSQNTFWLNKNIFYTLYLPTTVNFRYTDILRGYVALHQLHKNNKYLKFTPPSAVQERNEHNLYKDLLDEIEMYDSVLMVTDILIKNANHTIFEIYKKLEEKNIVDKNELIILKQFLKELSTFISCEV